MQLLQVVFAAKSLFKLLWEGIISHWEIATALFAGLSAGGTFLYRKILKIRKWYFDMESIRLQMPEISKKLDKLMSFVAPNGGNSVTDKLDRIERRSVLTQQLTWQMRENSQNGEFTADENGNWTRVNKTLLNLINAYEYQVTGFGWLGYVNDSEVDAIKEKYLHAIAEKRGVSFQCHFKRDFDVQWDVIFTLEPLRSDGNVIAYVGRIAKRN